MIRTCGIVCGVKGIQVQENKVGKAVELKKHREAEMSGCNSSVMWVKAGNVGWGHVVNGLNTKLKSFRINSKQETVQSFNIEAQLAQSYALEQINLLANWRVAFKVVNWRQKNQFRQLLLSGQKRIWD